MVMCDEGFLLGRYFESDIFNFKSWKIFNHSNQIGNLAYKNSWVLL